MAPNRSHCDNASLGNDRVADRKSVHNGCPHCRADFIDSIRTKENTADKIFLECRKCDWEYTLPNIGEQNRKLKSWKRGEPSQIIQIKSISDLKPCDQIAGKRVKGLYQHYGIVTGVNEATGKVEILHVTGDASESSSGLSSGGSKASVKKETLDFNAFKKKFDWNRRYLPLDCSPKSEMKAKAKEVLKNGAGKYNAFTNNCQHVANELKTGVASSAEGDFFGAPEVKVLGCIVAIAAVVTGVAVVGALASYGVSCVFPDTAPTAVPIAKGCCKVACVGAGIGACALGVGTVVGCGVSLCVTSASAALASAAATSASAAMASAAFASVSPAMASAALAYTSSAMASASAASALSAASTIASVAVAAAPVLAGVVVGLVVVSIVCGIFGWWSSD